MKLISDKSYIPHSTFQSGLNDRILKQVQNINIMSVQRNLLNHNIESSLNSKTVAFSVQQVFKIFDILKNTTKAKLFNINIPSIQTYIKEDLIFDFQGYGFCIPQTQSVIKNKEPFKTGSIFFEEEESIELLNAKVDEKFAKNERSSSHYLSPFIHEFLHNVYLNFIYKNYGSNAFNTLTKLQSLTFHACENNIIAKVIGSYATNPCNQYHEVFAETFTKLICNCLSNNSLPQKNPLNQLKLLPSEFLLILQKLFSL